MTVAISIAALAVSLSALLATRWRDRRDLLLRVHEQLSTTDQQRGRRLLSRIGRGTPVDGLTDQQYDLVNNALASLNTLGIYYHRRYINRNDVLELWADTLVRLAAPADKFLAASDTARGRRTRPQLNQLVKAAQQYKTGDGRWRRPRALGNTWARCR